MSSRRAQAEKQSRAAENVASAGMPRGLKVLRAMQVEVLRAYAQGGSIGNVLDSYTPIIAEEVRDAMVTGHLLGRHDVFIQAASQLTHRKSRGLDRASELRRFLEVRMDLKPEDIAQLNGMYGTTGLQISKTLTTEANRKLLDAIRESQARGEHTAAGMKRLREAFESLGLTTQQPYQIEAVWRTYSHLSYAAGSYNADSDPAIKEILVSYTYSTVGDDRVRETHAAMEGVTAPPDDPIWNEWKPPADWNCRCTLLRNFSPVPLKAAPASVKVGDREVPVQPGEGFRFDPGRLFRDMLHRVDKPQQRIAASMTSERPANDQRELYRAMPPRLRVVAAAVDIEDETGIPPYQKDIAQRLGLSRSTVSGHVSEAGKYLLHDPAAHRVEANEHGRMAVARARSAKREPCCA